MSNCLLTYGTYRHQLFSYACSVPPKAMLSLILRWQNPNNSEDSKNSVLSKRLISLHARWRCGTFWFFSYNKVFVRSFWADTRLRDLSKFEGIRKNVELLRSLFSGGRSVKMSIFDVFYGFYRSFLGSFWPILGCFWSFFDGDPFLRIRNHFSWSLKRSNQKLSENTSKNVYFRPFFVRY